MWEKNKINQAILGQIWIYWEKKIKFKYIILFGHELEFEKFKWTDFKHGFKNQTKLVSLTKNQTLICSDSYKNLKIKEKVILTRNCWSNRENCELRRLNWFSTISIN